MEQHVPRDVMCWEGHDITSVVFPPKMHDLNLLMRKHQANSDWRGIPQNNWSIHIRTVLERLKESKEAWTGFIPIKDISGKNGKFM